MEARHVREPTPARRSGLRDLCNPPGNSSISSLSSSIRSSPLSRSDRLHKKQHTLPIQYECDQRSATIGLALLISTCTIGLISLPKIA